MSIVTLEKDMNIDNIPSVQNSKEATVRPSVIQLKQIKSILYLGMKGDLKIDQVHNIDTFA
jgi:hypothetical protein